MIQQLPKSSQEFRRPGDQEVTRMDRSVVAANHPMYLLDSWPPDLL
jgi:hypothetical protein